MAKWFAESRLRSAGSCLAIATFLFSIAAVSVGTTGIVNAASRIGVAAGVENQVTGLVGGAPVRLKVGDGVFQDQVVETAVKSTAQLLFRDETALTVGPGSRVVLDKFIYNPASKTGDIVLNATKGAFRFVSGAATSSSYKITTPVATIGVRGTIFDYFINALGELILVLVEGEVEVCPTGRECMILSNPGQYVLVKADGSIGGPYSWSGALWDVSLGVPFPLFGRRFENDQTDTPTFIDPSDLNDALDGRDLEPEQIETPDDPLVTVD